MENRYHRPLAELTEEELLHSIRKEWQDMYDCWNELVRRGWTEADLERYV